MRVLEAGRSIRPSLVVVTATALLAAACGAPAQVTSAPTTAPAPTTTTAPTATVAPTTTVTSTSTGPACNETATVDAWPLPMRAAQLIVAPVQEDDVSAAQPLVAAGAGGLILFGTSAPEDLGTTLASIDQTSPEGVAPLVMTDEEGGGVQRMANLVGDIPWPRTMAQTLSTTQVQSLAETLGQKLRANGVTMDLAPVVDLSDSPGPDAEFPDGPRSFSPDPTVATAFGLAFAKGLESGGVIPVIKHFPGLGQATGNTDDEAASVPGLSVLSQAALLPFKSAIAAGLPVVMVSNASITGLTGSTPASLSSAAIGGLLRGELGFKGLVITDTLSAQAISEAGYSVPAATVQAVTAGADMVMYDVGGDPLATLQQSVQALVAAVDAGSISPAQLDAAVEAVLATKGVNPCSLPPPTTAAGP